MFCVGGDLEDHLVPNPCHGYLLLEQVVQIFLYYCGSVAMGIDKPHCW